MRRYTRAAALLTAVCLGVSALPPVSVSAADFSANYAEALQKSMYFYECQQAGPLPEWNEVEWRADSTMSDEITGGWYDAGDHVKFNLPMAYSASMLAWGLYQYPDGLEQTGELETYVNNLSLCWTISPPVTRATPPFIRLATDRWITPGGGRWSCWNTA